MKHLTLAQLVSCHPFLNIRWLCTTIILSLCPYMIFGQCLDDKTAGTNPADIAALDDDYNNPSPYVYGEMIGINDAGQYQSLQNDPNPITYLTTKMRAFHAMDYDFNENLVYGTPYANLTKPKDVNGIPDYMNVGNYGWFFGGQGMSNISAATEILNKEPDLTWKEKIWEESDWWPASAGLSIPDGIRESYKRYTETFIDVLAPNSGTRYIEVYQVGNELWDYPYEEDYHAMLEGAYAAFVNKYGSNTANWKMKLMPGSFQAATITNTCPTQDRDNSNCGTSATQMFNQMGDYLDVSDCNILSSLHAINTHVYPFDEGTLNYVHPEKAGGEFERFKAAVAFRDANSRLADKGVWLTEVGYDSYGEGLLPNGDPAAGVGQYSQAAMLLRVFMITSRYHLERVDFYMGFDQSRADNPWHGGLYNCSGFWRLGTDPQYGWASAKPSHGATPKPAFFAFRDFLDKFENKVFHEEVAQENDVYAYIIANPDGTEPYLVFWNPTATDDNNVFTDVTVNETVNLPAGYKVSTTSATPFSTTGNSTADPYEAYAATPFSGAVNGTSPGSTTITKVRRMPSYIQLEMEPGGVSFNSCPTDITVQTAGVVNWTAPTATTDCTIGGCPGNLISGFTYVGELNGSDYYLSENPQKWTDAKVTCESNGGHLVTIGSQAEQDFILSKINVAILIGISDEDDNGTLEWVTGEPITYTNWEPGQPYLDDMILYGVLDFWTIGGQWEIAHFWTARPFIMEIPCSGGAGNSTPTITQTQGPASGSYFNTGTTTIEYTATDDCNSTANCTFTVTVQGNPSCANYIEITTANATNATYHAGDWIYSFMNGGVLPGATVNYKAGNLIQLGEGFSVQPNANFSAEIEDCQ